MEEEKSLVNKKSKNEKIKKEKVLLLIIVLFIIIIDHMVKLYIVNVKEVQVIPNILRFNITENTLKNNIKQYKII